MIPKFLISKLAQMFFTWHKTSSQIKITSYFFYNWFTSVPLLHQHLTTRKIWCCSTVRLNRLTGLSKSLSEEKQLMEKGRGYEERVLVQDGTHVTLVRWFDNKIVNLISTFAKANPLSTISRYDSKSKQNIELILPDIVKRYNQSMGAVDLADHLLSLYRINAKSKKFYHKLIFYFLNMALVNSWLLYRNDAASLSLPKKEILGLSEFKLHVAVSLTKTGKVSQPVSRGRPSTRPSEPQSKRHRAAFPCDDVRFDNVAHVPYIAQLRNRCKDGKCSGKTHIYCKKCNVNLCLDKKKNCFASFHGY